MKKRVLKKNWDALQKEKNKRELEMLYEYFEDLEWEQYIWFSSLKISCDQYDYGIYKMTYRLVIVEEKIENGKGKFDVTQKLKYVHT